MSTKAMIQSPRWEFSAPLTQAVQATLNDWQSGKKMARLWRGDPTLWTSDDEDKWVGWLPIVEDQLAHLKQLNNAATDAAKAGFTHALLLGMGGSSLCPEVLKITYGKQPGHPELHVLDSTDPAQIKSIENQVDLAKTLCIVASKSGSTLEPNIFKQYFFDRMQQVVGKDKAGDHFIAITDSGSKMQQVAERDHFRKIF
ncbi:MAG TPA: transaldolase, partial [Candidatus Angelobacter sp.]|nr:transaldolase [Candidatus Angelobacter sp.]